MILTQRILYLLRSDKGAWKGHTVRMLGTNWENNKGWKRDVIGKDYPRDYLKLIWHMRNLTPKQNQRVLKDLFFHYKEKQQ